MLPAPWKTICSEGYETETLSKFVRNFFPKLNNWLKASESYTL